MAGERFAWVCRFSANLLMAADGTFLFIYGFVGDTDSVHRGPWRRGVTVVGDLVGVALIMRSLVLILRAHRRRRSARAGANPSRESTGARQSLRRAEQVLSDAHNLLGAAGAAVVLLSQAFGEGVVLGEIVGAVGAVVLLCGAVPTVVQARRARAFLATQA